MLNLSRAISVPNLTPKTTDGNSTPSETSHVSIMGKTETPERSEIGDAEEATITRLPFGAVAEKSLSTPASQWKEWVSEGGKPLLEKCDSTIKKIHKELAIYEMLTEVLKVFQGKGNPTADEPFWAKGENCSDLAGVYQDLLAGKQVSPLSNFVGKPLIKDSFQTEEKIEYLSALILDRAKFLKFYLTAAVEYEQQLAIELEAAVSRIAQPSGVNVLAESIMESL